MNTKKNQQNTRKCRKGEKYKQKKYKTNGKELSQCNGKFFLIKNYFKCK